MAALRHRIFSIACVWLLIGTSSLPAGAGRSRYGWLYDTETNGERNVEIESWISEENGIRPPPTQTTRWWFGPVIGLTDRVDLALPIEVVFGSGGVPSSTNLESFGAEVRWRLTNPDPVERGPVSFLLRFAAKRPLLDRSLFRFEGDAVLGIELGRVHLAATIGTVVEASSDGQTAEINPGFGVSVRTVGELRLGFEFYGEIAPGDGWTWTAIGPNLAWTHGRFWLSGSFGIGLQGITTAPRLKWGIAF